MSRVPGAKKKIGRPVIGATPVNTRLPPMELATLDAWIATQPDPKPSRPEAIRRLLAVALDPKARGSEACQR